MSISETCYKPRERKKNKNPLHKWKQSCLVEGDVQTEHTRRYNISQAGKIM